MQNPNYADNDPRHHTTSVQNMLAEVIEHVRADVRKVGEPKAQALLETHGGSTAGSRHGLSALRTSFRAGAAAQQPKHVGSKLAAD